MTPFCAACGDAVYQTMANVRDPRQPLWLHRNGTLYEYAGFAPHRPVLS